MLTVLGIIAAACLVLFLIALIAPLRIGFASISGHMTGTLSYLGTRAVVDLTAKRWTLYHLGLRVGSGRLAEGKPPKAKVEKPAKEKPEKPPVHWRQRLGEVRAQSPVLRKTLRVILRLIGRLLRAWRLDEGFLRLRWGTGNPAHTGMMLGYAHALRGCLLRAWPRLEIVLTPEFNERVFAADAGLTLRIVPIAPLWHLLRAVGTLPWRGLWKLKKAWAS